MKVIEDILGKGSLSDLMSNKAVCRTSPATPGLSKIVFSKAHDILHALFILLNKVLVCSKGNLQTDKKNCQIIYYFFQHS